MPKYNIDNAQVSDYQNSTRIRIPSMQTDGADNTDETYYINENWPQYWGYFNQVSDLKSALILKAIWDVGKGYEADTVTEARLDNITGWGKDTFKDILFNLDLVSLIGGDSFAEVIRDKEGNMINLKPLDPGTIRIVIDSKGILKRYEQISKTGDKIKVTKEFKTQEIFHLANNRTADQMHGISDILGLENVILAEQESFKDLSMLSHFQAKPFIIFKMKTDNVQKINNFKAKIRTGREGGEDMFIPDDENLLSWEVVTVNPSNFLLQWRDDLRNKFYRVIGLPQIVPGGGTSNTDTDSKVVFLAFEQVIMHRQQFIEKQIWSQLAIRINLIHPTLMEDLLGQQVKKDGAGELTAKASDLNAATGEAIQ